jgi:octaprenyl-diphosphate synthase
MTLEEIRALIQADLHSVDGVIRARLKSAVPLVDQVAEHIISGGGKRLRPLLVLLAARACGHQGASHIEAAAFIEFIHTATLLHDAEGEVLQLMNAHNPDTTEQRYLDVIYRKTAKLFEAGAEVAAVLAQAPPPVRRALAAYGRHLGTAYQLVDDVLDYRSTPQERGKNLGDDLAEGKPTLPLIHALKSGTETQRAAIRRAIEQGGLEQLELVVAAIESTGGLEYTARVAREELERALTSLEALPDSSYKDGLAALARFAVEHTT